MIDRRYTRTLYYLDDHWDHQVAVFGPGLESVKDNMSETKKLKKKKFKLLKIWVFFIVPVK
jgi:hypothetical protein